MPETSPTTGTSTIPQARSGYPPGTDQDEQHGVLHQIAAQSHSPDSFARALFAGILQDLAEQDGPLEDQAITLEVKARRIESATDSSGHGLIELCVTPSHGHEFCVWWPPPLPISYH